jgi:hypothetical protein
LGKFNQFLLELPVVLGPLCCHHGKLLLFCSLTYPPGFCSISKLISVGLSPALLITNNSNKL